MEELRNAKEREGEMKKLLVGTERLGRELEDKLAERDEKLKAAERRIGELEKEREKEGMKEGAREKLRLEDEGDRAVDEVLRKEQEEKRLELEGRIESLVNARESERREWDVKDAEREHELEEVKERLAKRELESDEERKDLNSQLDTLRSAGQALCQTYEERIAEIEESRIDSLELVESLQSQLEQLRNPSSTNDNPTSTDRDADLPSPNYPSSTSHNPLLRQHSTSTSAADFIDAENALADLEHMSIKVEKLEEQLEEAKMHLEAEVADTRRRRIKSGEVELGLKKEIAGLRETVGEWCVACVCQSESEANFSIIRTIGSR